MSIKYLFFTEIKINGTWECINNPVFKTYPFFEHSIVPTYENNSHTCFEKTYLKIKEDGYGIKIDDISDSLRCKIIENNIHIGEPQTALHYKFILNYLKGTTKEHYGFASRKEVADFESGQEDEIYDYVSIDIYKKMDSELRKAYQYYEWNDRTSIYHYYNILCQEVQKQLRLWNCRNNAELIEDLRLIMFIS